MPALDDKLAEMDRIKAELQRMENDDTVTEEEDGDLRDTLVKRWKTLDKECKPIIDRMSEISAITRTANATEANLERPDGGPELSQRGYGEGNSRYGSPDLVIRNNRDPYDANEMIRNERQIMMTRGEIRERALDAIELEVKRGNLASEFAEEATQKTQNQFFGNSNIARHILLTGGDDYRDAFQAYIEDPQGQAQRTALSLTNANGGYLLPFVLDPTVILTNAGSANPWRRISNVKQTTSNTWNGVNSAGVTAAWLAEAGVAADATPTVGNIVVTPAKAAAWVFGSYEVLEDTDFGQQLPRLLADAKDRLEEAAFATGSGSGQPQGAVNGATTVVTTATTTVIALADIYATQAALPARFRNAPGCSWVANVSIINKIRQLDTAGGASFWTNLGKGQPETLLGAPIYESTTMSSSVATTTLEAIFGDFGQFIIVDRVGVSMVYEPLVKDTSTARPTGQAGWFMFWRTGSQLSTINAFRVMKGL
jgi:HK97 family phage major capsid protein